MRLKIPYESLDPLTIGAADDAAKVYREELELEIRDSNVLAAIYPEEPEPVADATEEARRALAEPASGPPFRELIDAAKSVAVVIDNQFRPTPASKLLPAVLDVLEEVGVEDVCVATGNGKVFPLSESDIEMKVGRENLDRMERLGISLYQNEPRNQDLYTYLGVTSRGTPTWVLSEVVERDVSIAIGPARAP
jgi:lactate racemase